MPVYFAAARSAAVSPVARVLAKRAPQPAANDGATIDPVVDAALRAALLHFADHGLGAAKVACTRAEQALAAGDETDGRHWAAICRALDRRLAAELEASPARARGPSDAKVRFPLTAR